MDVKKIAFLSLAISAQDGVISEKELEKTYSLLRKKSNINKNEFELLVDEFFSDNGTIEEYVDQALSSGFDSKFILNFCLKAAESDGLDIRENISFLKACKILKHDPEEIIDA